MKHYIGASNPMRKQFNPQASYVAEHFAWSFADGVGTVTLNRPDRKNPLTFQSYAELRDFFYALRFDTDNDPHLDLFLPFSALIQLHPAVFLAARTGVRWVDFDDLAFPLGFEFGYTIANDVRPLMDITLGFGFPALVTPNNPDKAQEDVWQVTIAGYAYFAL